MVWHDARRYRAAKVRYSCTNRNCGNIRQGKELHQTTSAIVAAIQVKAIKLLHGLSSFPGRQFVFNGASFLYR